MKSTRKAWQKAGSPLDAEDRKLLGQVVIWATGGVFVLVGGAAGVSLAIRVFWAVQG